MSARAMRMPAPGHDALPDTPPRDAVVLGPLGFYDTLPERDWIRLGATGRYERRRAYQSAVAALELAKQQERPAEIILRLDHARRRIVAEHRATLRWRRRQERRRHLVRTLLGEHGPWPR
jgi:hypothetical protein